MEVDYRGNDLALVAPLLAGDDDEGSIANCRIDYGNALDLEYEELALADDGFGTGEELLFEMLRNRYQLKLTLEGEGPYGSESDCVIDYKEQNERKRGFGPQRGTG